jgi:hypothetical protein
METMGLEEDELLLQVRQCIIGGAGKEQWLSLHIFTPSARELGAFRVRLLPNGRLLSVPAHPPPQQVEVQRTPPPLEEEQQPTQSPSQLDVDRIVVGPESLSSESSSLPPEDPAYQGQQTPLPRSETTAAILPSCPNIRNTLSAVPGDQQPLTTDAEAETVVEADQDAIGDAGDVVDCSETPVPDQEIAVNLSSTTPSDGSRDDTGTTHACRRSSRVAEMKSTPSTSNVGSVPASSTSSPAASTSPSRSSKRRQSAAVVVRGCESEADVDDDDGTEGKQSSKRRRAVTAAQRDDSHQQEVKDEDEVATLVNKLQDAHRSRDSNDLDSVSRDAVLQLSQLVMGSAGEKDEKDDSDVLYLTSAKQVSCVITTSTSLKVVGYYLRAALVDRVRRRHRKSYLSATRKLLGIKSGADIVAYSSFYAFVQQHCPSVARGGQDVESWMSEPLFLADISWRDWRRYLSRRNRWIIETALHRFHLSIQPFQDWQLLGLVEVYDAARLGQSVRAVRNLPLSKDRRSGRGAVVTADLSASLPPLQAEQSVDPSYAVSWDSKHRFDAQHHWTGKINHLPTPHANLRLNATGKLVQVRDIAGGEALTYDYGVDYWVFQMTGLSLSEWLVSHSVASNKGILDLFTRMHGGVHDYTARLSQEWVQRRPAIWSELEREMWMDQLAGYLESMMALSGV